MNSGQAIQLRRFDLGVAVKPRRVRRDRGHSWRERRYRLLPPIRSSTTPSMS